MTQKRTKNWDNKIVGYGTKPASQFTANPMNHRKHPQAQRRAMTASLNELGWVNVVIENVRTGNLLDGHERIWQALQADDAEVPYIQVDLAPEDEHLALAILDRITGMAEIDPAMLNMLLQDVNTGEAALQELLAQMADEAGIVSGDESTVDAEPQIDKAEELRVKWGVETGQLWELGEHRLLCGDSTKDEDVKRVMGGLNASITFTSPPYNAGVSAKLRGNTSINDNFYKGEYDDNKSQTEYLNLLERFTDAAFDVSEYVFVNLQLLAGNKTAFIEYLYHNNYKLADIAIWDKKHATPAAAQRVMDSRFEFVVIFSHSATRAIGTREFRGMVHNVYEGSPQRHNEYSASHAATFPVDLPVHFIKTFTNANDVVYEPFNGTGTTLIACEQLGRRCRAIEISPGYVAVALQRWADATGKEPVLLK